MKTRKEIISLLSTDTSKLKKRFKVKSMAIFGSYAREEQKADSDVDILVEVDPSIGLDFVTLAEEIEKLIGIPVDLVSRGAVKSRYWEVIKQELVYV